MVRLVCISVLVVTALLHSVLGEKRLLLPLFRQALPRESMPLGRAFTERTLRFVWHLLSVSWISIACLVARADDLTLMIVGATLLASSALALVVSRGRHFAWALFAVGGAAALFGPQLEQVGPIAGGIAAVVLLAIAGLHVAWEFGLRWGRSVAIPEVQGRPAFHPPRGLTALVALACGLAAGAVAFAVRSPDVAFAWLALGGAFVFAARALGDFRLVGLTKRVYSTNFARWDDRLFTPLSLLLAVCFALVGARGLT